MAVGQRRRSGARRRWGLACLLLCGVCSASAAGLAGREADQQQRAAGAEGGGDPDEGSEETVREDDVPEALPPLQEEHAYFAALDLDRGNHFPLIVLPCSSVLPAPSARACSVQ